ncbi:MAG: metallophosphoesterase [Chitinophagaceae bacterium]|nr:metallophosphoesterase [Chitinophagaceae bacterium]
MKKYIALFLYFVIILLRANAGQSPPDFVIHPYLQYTTPTSIRIHWETPDSATTQVYYGTAKLHTGQPVWDDQFTIPGKRIIHYAPLVNLQPETIYFYKTVSVLPGGDSLVSATHTFQTAVKDSSAFAFTIFSDSQIDAADPGAWGRVVGEALKERPNFALHAGDLVDLGYRKKDWVTDFFLPARNFMNTIPIYTIPGNHEHDAAWYYQYLYVPQPYYYSFRYGNAEVFMLDTNQYQEEGTDLYGWLEQALAKSTAYWKFVVHHHPPFSSDEDDFGNTRLEAATSGDDEVQSLTALYDKYDVDIVFYGHIHTYERTWPILSNKTVNENGVIYINTGGAGGRLENPAPIRSWFTNKLRTVHHFGYVRINGSTLEYQAIDENGVLFDSFLLTESRKNKIAKNLTPAAPVATGKRKIFTDTIQVELQPALPGEVTRYTLNNSEPGKNSPEYKQKIILDKSATVKAASFNRYGKSRTHSIHYIKEKAYPAIVLHQPHPGLHYRYFTGELKDNDLGKFRNLSFSVEGTVTHPGFTGIPHSKQYWGVIYEGYIRVPADGYYRFYGHADHILRLDIHDKMLFEELDREINYEGDIYLKAGYHPVKLYYYNSRSDRYFLELYYSGPGIERQAIPVESWWRAAGGRP